MLSLLYSKPPASATDLPKVVDFNTIDRDAASSTASPQHGRSFFGLWPFAAKAKPGEPAAQAGRPPCADARLLDTTDKVIAMKAVAAPTLEHTSVPGDGATASLDTHGLGPEMDAEEEFIDIQLRQLSYAEVAALNLKAPKAHAGQKTSVRHELVVVDQEDELEKTISDMEMVETFRNHETFLDHPLANMDSLSPEDEWDIYAETKIPKKVSRKKKSHTKRTAVP